MKLQLLRTAREAVSEVRDSFAGESFAIVDLDGRSGTRLLLQTAAGTLPVIAITGRQWRWVTSMLRHHRIGATISKPVTMEALQAALARIHDFHLMSDFSGN